LELRDIPTATPKPCRAHRADAFAINPQIHQYTQRPALYEFFVSALLINNAIL
jgi:hypothetical protein